MKTNTKVKLPKQIKDKWVKALRSGKFEQGKSELYDSVSDTYCCLGVLGKVCGLDNKVLDDKGLLYDLTDFPNGCQLPAAFKETNVDSPGYRLQQKLSLLNDARNWKFSSIANYIEKNL